MHTSAPTQLDAMQGMQDLRRSFVGKVFLAIGASAFVALCAHISVPLFFTPVPLTLQTLAVLLTGLVLGPELGFSALALYLAEGAAGLPVFSPLGMGGIAQLLGPTGGFLFSYPLAAAAAGSIVRAAGTPHSRFYAALFAGAAGTLLIFCMGAGWASHLLHLSAGATWHLAIAPFLPGEVLKITAVAGAYAGIRAVRRS